MKRIIEKTMKYLLIIALLLSATIMLLELFSKYQPAKIINENAPVKTKKTVVINAPAEKVWSVFTNVSQWPSWQKEIATATVDAGFQPGSVIKWKTSGFSIQSELQTVEPHKLIGWAGEAFGSFAIHVWSFEEHNGYTTVTVEESMEGWLVWLMQSYVQAGLHKSTEYWLEALKQESEKIG